MISKQAKSSIDYLFTEAARLSLVLHPDDACSIQAVARDASTTVRDAGTVLVITCSSFLFRFVTLLRIGDNTETRAYYAQGATGEENAADALFEAANLCTGRNKPGALPTFPSRWNVDAIFAQRCLLGAPRGSAAAAHPELRNHDPASCAPPGDSLSMQLRADRLLRQQDCPGPTQPPPASSSFSSNHFGINRNDADRIQRQACQQGAGAR